MKAWAVVGANYGDEGKGLMTDYLVRKNNIQVVCRYNGGAQAGHTVQLPNGKRHVFHHYSSGTFAGAVTYLGPRFISNPYLFVQEQKELKALDAMFTPFVLVSRASIITTPYDMLLNQKAENMRKGQRHGSCGVGIFETITRDHNPEFRLNALDLFQNGVPNLVNVLQRIRRDYVPYRAKELGLSKEDTEYCMKEGFIDSFVDRCQQFVSSCAVASLDTVLKNRRVLFEGAQGLALDQGNVDDFPHLTPSNTGSRNIIELLQYSDIDEIEIVYATRSYLTRHGNGPLKHECLRDDLSPTINDPTNVPHDFQGTLRYAPLNPENSDAMMRRIADDANLWPQGGSVKATWRIAMTCLDQYHSPMKEIASYKSFGPTYQDVHSTQDEVEVA